MIIGSGIDIVEIERIKKIRLRYQGRFLNRIFSAREKNYCQNKKRIDNHLSGRFAAKEAFIKALGENIPGLNWCDLEINNNKKGKPKISLLGKAKDLIKDLEIKNISLSISHTDSFAMAQVILEK